MPTDHFAVAGVPATGATALLRSGLVGRYAYCLAAGESAADFVAVDPDNGAVVPALIQNGALYGLDALDATTAAGPTCLVSSEGKRYKLNSLTTPFAVLSKAATSPPVSPVIGDGYLLYSTPSGAWSGKIGNIGIYTSRGWEFMLPPIGFRIYVEDENAFYYRDNNGDWQSGLGAVLVPDSSIALSKLIWDGRVENQTTNTPPSAAQGTAYIIGSSPTGAWAGNAGKIAIREVTGTGSTYIIYTPKTGQEVYDKALGIKVRWTGTAWESAAGSIVGSRTVMTDGTTNTTFVAGSDCAFDLSLVPTTSSRRRTDDRTITYAAKTVGNVLEIEWSGWVVAVGTDTVAIALYRDSESNALEWFPVPLNNSTVYVTYKFHILVADKSSHVYKIGITTSGAGAIFASALKLRRFTLKEVAEN